VHSGVCTYAENYSLYWTWRECVHNWRKLEKHF